MSYGEDYHAENGLLELILYRLLRWYLQRFIFCR